MQLTSQRFRGKTTREPVFLEGAEVVADSRVTQLAHPVFHVLFRGWIGPQNLCSSRLPNEEAPRLGKWLGLPRPACEPARIMSHQSPGP
jgi:hypothetical protein